MNKSIAALTCAAGVGILGLMFLITSAAQSPGEAEKDELSMRFTTIIVRRDGRWQLVLAQGTPIQKPAGNGKAQ